MHIFPDKKVYVGITRQKINARWQNGQGYKGQPVYNLIQLYGWDNIEHKIIAEHLTQDEAQQMEKELISEYNQEGGVYNFSKGGDTGCDSWVRYEYQGTLYTAQEIADMSLPEITAHDIGTRVRYHGWTLERAMTTPKMKKDYRWEYNGEYLSVNELYEIRINKDLTKAQIKTRLLQHHWDPYRAITQPNNQKRQPKGTGTCLFEYKGKFYKSHELAEMSGIPGLTSSDVRDRIKTKGWSVERAITQPKRKSPQRKTLNVEKCA